MNERIQELYNKAWLKVDPLNPQETFTNAFAELIIRECAGLCVSNIADEICGGKGFSDKIKQHFGVDQ